MQLRFSFSTCLGLSIGYSEQTNRPCGAYYQVRLSSGPSTEDHSSQSERRQSRPSAKQWPTNLAIWENTLKTHSGTRTRYLVLHNTLAWSGATMLHEASWYVHLMTQGNKGQRMFVRMQGFYRHEALETKYVSGIASGDFIVAHRWWADKQMRVGTWLSTINLQLALVLWNQPPFHIALVW